MTATATEIADRLCEQHAQWFREHPTAPLVQTVMFEQENGEVHFVACPWRDAAERDFVIAGLRVIMAARKVFRYAVWSEVWIKNVKVPPGQRQGDHARRWAKGYTHGDLSVDPERQEAVFTLVVERGRKHTTRLQLIERGRSGGVRRLVLEDSGPLENMGGALADLMPDQVVH